MAKTLTIRQRDSLRKRFGKSQALRELSEKAKAVGILVFEATPESVRKRPREPMFGDVVIDEWNDDG